MDKRGLHIILEQSKIKDWLDKQIHSNEAQEVITKYNIVAAESKNCAVCSKKSPKVRPLKNKDQTTNSNGLLFDQIFVKIKGDVKNFKGLLDEILKNDVLYDVDTTDSSFDALPKEEKDRYKSLSGSEESRLKEVCNMLTTLIAFIKNSNSDSTAVTDAVGYWRKICKKFKVKYDKEKKKKKKEDGGGSTVELDKVSGCIDPKAFNYYCKKNECGEDNDTLPDLELMNTLRCDYVVDLNLTYTYILSNLNNGNPEDSINTWPAGPISILGSSSFDSPGSNSWLNRTYPAEKKYWTDLCSNISDTTINFDTEVGLYKNQGDKAIQADLVNALLKFSNDDKVDGKDFIKKTKIMIMDDNNNNLGIVSLHEGGLTLDNRMYGSVKRLTDIVLYRAKKNRGSTVSTTREGYEDSPVSDFRDYFNSKWFSVDTRGLISVDDNFKIDVKIPVEEATIGLGTLLERKDKPIIGLGGL
jgi:hypothetical protein